jgi:hypothetical protein
MSNVTKVHAGHSGLRGHSVGELYPWSIVGLGNVGRKVRWQARNLITGEIGPIRFTQEMAEYDAKRRLAGRSVATRYSRETSSLPCQECGKLWTTPDGAADCCTLPEYLQASVADPAVVATIATLLDNLPEYFGHLQARRAIVVTAYRSGLLTAEETESLAERFHIRGVDIAPPLD